MGLADWVGSVVHSILPSQDDSDALAQGGGDDQSDDPSLPQNQGTSQQDQGGGGGGGLLSTIGGMVKSGAHLAATGIKDVMGAKLPTSALRYAPVPGANAAADALDQLGVHSVSPGQVMDLPGAAYRATGVGKYLPAPVNSAISTGLDIAVPAILTGGVSAIPKALAIGAGSGILSEGGSQATKALGGTPEEQQLANLLGMLAGGAAAGHFAGPAAEGAAGAARDYAAKAMENAPAITSAVDATGLGPKLTPPAPVSAGMGLGTHILSENAGRTNAVDYPTDRVLAGRDVPNIATHQLIQPEDLPGVGDAQTRQAMAQMWHDDLIDAKTPADKSAIQEQLGRLRAQNDIADIMASNSTKDALDTINEQSVGLKAPRNAETRGYRDAFREAHMSLASAVDDLASGKTPGPANPTTPNIETNVFDKRPNVDINANGQPEINGQMAQATGTIERAAKRLTEPTVEDAARGIGARAPEDWQAMNDAERAQFLTDMGHPPGVKPELPSNFPKPAESEIAPAATPANGNTSTPPPAASITPASRGAPPAGSENTVSPPNAAPETPAEKLVYAGNEAPRQPSSTPLPQSQAEPKLPSGLQGAKPRYQNAEVRFANDIDRAAYIVASRGSNADYHYLQFLKDNVPGMTESEARAYGRDIRQNMKSLPIEDGIMRVPRQGRPWEAPAEATPTERPPGFQEAPAGKTETPQDWASRTLHNADAVEAAAKQADATWGDLKAKAASLREGSPLDQPAAGLYEKAAAQEPQATSRNEYNSWRRTAFEGDGGDNGNGGGNTNNGSSSGGNSNSQGGGVGNGGRTTNATTPPGPASNPYRPESLMGRLYREALDLIQIPVRTLTFGHEPIFRQGVGTAVTHPTDALLALRNMVRVLKDPQGYEAITGELNNLPFVRGDAYLADGRSIKDLGLRAEDFINHGQGGQLRDTFVSQAFNKLTLGLSERSGQSARAYLDTLRKSVYNSEATRLAKLGITDPKMYEDTWSAISHATGHGIANSPTPRWGSAIAFSPQALIGRFLSLFDPFTKSGSPLPWDAGARANAVRNLIGVAGVMGTVNLVGSLTGAKINIPGITTSPLTQTFKGKGPIADALGLGGKPIVSANSSIGKVGYGTTKIDPSAGYGPVLRLFGNVANDLRQGDPKLVSDHVAEYMRGQMGPTADLVVEALTGTDYKGDQFKLADLKSKNQIIDRLAPIGANAIYHAVQSPQGNPLAASVSLGAMGGDTGKTSAQFLKAMPNGNWRDYNQYLTDQEKLQPYYDAPEKAFQLMRSEGKIAPLLSNYQSLQDFRDHATNVITQAGFSDPAVAKRVEKLIEHDLGLSKAEGAAYDITLAQHPELVPLVNKWLRSQPAT